MHRTFYLSEHSKTPRVRRIVVAGFSYLPMIAILAIMSIAAMLYMTIGRPDLAVDAYTKARELGNSDLLLESRLVKTAFESDSNSQPGNGAPSPAVEPPAK